MCTKARIKNVASSGYVSCQDDDIGALTRIEVLKAPLRPYVSTADTTAEAGSCLGSRVGLMLTRFHFSEPLSCLRPAMSSTSTAVEKSGEHGNFPDRRESLLEVEGQGRDHHR